MKIYKISITADKWPSDFTVEATGWATAVNRAIKEWKRSSGKGSRSETLFIKAIKFGGPSKESGEEPK
jgi:hypothetical protein